MSTTDSYKSAINNERQDKEIEALQEQIKQLESKLNDMWEVLRAIAARLSRLEDGE